LVATEGTGGAEGVVKRPLLIRMLPARLRVAAWELLYQNRHAFWRPLYEAATLLYAPGVSMELVPGDVISDRIAFTGLYELPLTRRVLELARRGGTLIDVGANLGYFPLLWAAARPDNKCVAFEASPRNIDLLRRNVARNGLGDRIAVIPHAAGAAPGRLRFDVGHDSQTGWGGSPRRAAAASRWTWFAWMKWSSRMTRSRCSRWTSRGRTPGR
jgi:hypothetical protein